MHISLFASSCGGTKVVWPAGHMMSQRRPGMLFHRANAKSGDSFQTMVLCPAPPSVPGAGAGTVTGVGHPGVCTGGVSH